MSGDKVMPVWRPAAALIYTMAVFVLSVGCGDKVLAPGESLDALADADGLSPSLDTTENSDTPDNTGTEDSGQPLTDTTATEDGSTPVCPPEGLMPTQCPCLDNKDCESGFCVQTADGKLCTEPCQQDCPSGYSCELVSGFGSDTIFLCLPMNVNLCRPCQTNTDCDDIYFEQGERCVSYGDFGSFCGVACAKGCPEGTSCQSAVDVDGTTVEQCVSDSGECECSPLAIQQGAITNCSVNTADGTCSGTRKCGPNGLTECNAVSGEEVCDGLDNDCDGLVDEDTCKAPNANAAACVNGECKILDCDAGFVDADNVFENGCECQSTDEICDGTDNDCDGQIDEGSLCSGAEGCEGLCVEGQCTCPGGCELCGTQCVAKVSYATDTENCGYCGHVCDLANTAVHKCDAGVCCPVICKDGYKDCNGECADGCELKVATETCDGQDNDCDGVVDDVPLADCPAPGSCANGICLCDTSNPSLKKCDGLCTNIKEDIDNCGACGNKCADLGVPNVLTYECVDGKCVIGQCKPPYYDANQDIFDGCECQKTSVLEQCDMLDNNCDGIIDGQTQTCETQCGTGSQICVAGVWEACDAAEPITCTDYNTCADTSFCGDNCPAEPAEMCNGLDDNCNKAIDEGFLCKAGEILNKSCGDQCGLQSYVCSNSCEWTELGDCVPQGECTPGATNTAGCGQCGTKTRTCTSACGWGAFGACSDEKTCATGATESQNCSNCGTQTRTCTGECEWPAWGPCGDQGACAPGQVGEQSCGTCGIQKRTCTGQCGWGDFGACVEGGACVPGATESQNCGSCGSKTRTCNNQCQWGGFGSCNGQGSCSPGQTDSQGCGQCGSKTRTCNNQCQWDGFGSCNGQGSCSPGQTDSQGCGQCGSKTRTCGGNCQWAGFGGCSGQGPCSPGQSQACGACNTGTSQCNGGCQWGSCQGVTGCLPPKITIHRHYYSGGSNNADHMFTQSGSSPAGYSYEGPHFFLFQSSFAGMTTLYQCYHSGIKDHLQTTNPGECSSNGYGGLQALGFCSTSKTGNTPNELKRLYSPSMKDHFVTLNAAGEAAGDPSYSIEGTVCWVP
jgi:hypothetical protein